MTQEQFDNYKFGVNTEIFYKGNWWKLDSVDFEKRTLSPKTTKVYWLEFNEVEDIRN